MNDPILLKVALTAFGLEEDQQNKFFIKKILNDGSIEPSALANKMSDKRYLDLTKAFGFGDFATPNTSLSTFGEKITQKFLNQSFEAAVGDIDSDMRLAMSSAREISKIANTTGSDTTKWLTVMGNPPLRKVFEVSFNLPSSFSALDLDKQIEIFQDRAQARFQQSDISQFSDPEKQQKLVQTFLFQREIASITQSQNAGQRALTLLQNARINWNTF
ncbi:MAG: DUF1217 domain-containing protein [Halocynthiibacter sp.]